jgi:hypothetical protein
LRRFDAAHTAGSVVGSGRATTSIVWANVPVAPLASVAMIVTA